MITDLVKLLVTNFDFPMDYDIEIDFVEEGLIDSFSLRELCNIIEEDMSIRIEDYEVIANQLVTIELLAEELVRRS